MKQFVEYFLENKAISWLLLVLILAIGSFAYAKMGKLEDAPFTIKQAVVTTSYPGASPSEVQTQVTDVIEESIQSLGELYYLKTENRYGLSKITVFVKKEIRAKDMQQLWDKLRRKVNDVQTKLPPGAGPSVVNDDFGDVLGVFYGIYGYNCTYRELEDKAKELKNEILKIKDVAKVELYGVQTATIDITINPTILSQSGITSEDIRKAFEKQNNIVDAGAIETVDNRMRIDITGSFCSIEEIRNLTVVSTKNEYFRLGDIAVIEEGYKTPARNIMKIENHPSIGIAISTVSGGNVVNMSKAVKELISDFSKQIPSQYSIKCLYDQGHESSVANDGFIANLIISVLTVVAILLLFIGFKNGVLIGSGLIFTIMGTLIYMWLNGIALQRMSLAAIIIAMGMLVDNAIVVSDSALINIQRGMLKRDAILKATTGTAMPLLAATTIAVLTFLPLYLSPHITGELLSSFFIVIAVSLFLSWVLAVTQVPFFIQTFVKDNTGEKTEPFSGKIYNWLRNIIEKSIQHKWIVIIVMIILLAFSIFGFRYIPKNFMPQLNKQYFTIDMWMPEGTRIERMETVTDMVSDFLTKQNGIIDVSTYIGQTPPRYYLANTAFGPQSNYAQCLVKAESPKASMKMQPLLQDTMPKLFPELMLRVNKFELSSVPEAEIEARFCGPDVTVLDSLTNLALQIMRKNPKVINAHNEWGNKAMIVKADYDPIKAGYLDISKSSMMESAKSIHDGVVVGVYRDKEKKVPVCLKSDIDIDGISQFSDFSIWNGGSSTPMVQATDDIRIAWEWPLIKTYNRQLSMAAQCDTRDDATMDEVLSEIRPAIEQIKIPDGYSFFWDAKYKDQKEGIAALTKYFPMALLFLVIILVALFGNYRQPLIIFLIMPLSFIGVATGLLMTGFEFGFFCMAGWIGLLGMIIKNVIVLIDEINNLTASGYEPHKAVIEATVSRTRPVLMAAGTTVFGMVPLLFDVVFQGMAATIVFGLTFATILTLFVTPALYSIFYKIKK